MPGKHGGGGRDRRRSQRESFKIPIDYSAVDAFFSEFTTNINEGGMFVETENPAPLDTIVQLQFRLPSLEQPLQLTGRVAWVSDGKSDSEAAGMGIEFQDLSMEVRDTINKLVRLLRNGR